MVRDTREKWTRLVERWERSGRTAKAFALDAGINAGTLQHYKWRLGCLGRDAQTENARRPREFGFVEVRARDLPQVGHDGPDDKIEVVLANGVRVVVPTGFDTDALRRVMAALEAAR